MFTVTKTSLQKAGNKRQNDRKVKRNGNKKQSETRKRSWSNWSDV